MYSDYLIIISDCIIFNIDIDCMSVLLETSLGDITIDLYTKECPLATFNFLKLCKMKYYNHCLFYDI